MAFFIIGQSDDLIYIKGKNLTQVIRY
jgi:hypothetical protein